MPVFQKKTFFPKAGSIGAIFLWASGLVDLAIFRGRGPKSRIPFFLITILLIFLGRISCRYSKKEKKNFPQGGFRWAIFLWARALVDLAIFSGRDQKVG